MPEPDLPGRAWQRSRDLRPDSGHFHQRVGRRPGRQHHNDERRRRLHGGARGHYRSAMHAFTGGGGTRAAATATLGTAAVASVSLSNTGGLRLHDSPCCQSLWWRWDGRFGHGDPWQRLVFAASRSLLEAAVIRPRLQSSSRPRLLVALKLPLRQLSRPADSAGLPPLTVTNPGSGYTTRSCNHLHRGGAGSGATATAALGARVTGFTVVGGSGYSSAPAVTVAAPPSSNCVPASLCTAATATAALAPRVVAASR